MPQTKRVERRAICPTCGNKGRRVGVETLRALLTDQHDGLIHALEANSCCETDDAIGPGCKPADNDSGWRFCEAINCDIVYFAERTDATFAKSDLRVQVGVKETTGERPLCYCFGHSVNSIKQALCSKDLRDALDDLRAGKFTGAAVVTVTAE